MLPTAAAHGATNPAALGQTTDQGATDRINGKLDAYGNEYEYNTVEASSAEPARESEPGVRIIRVLCLHGACLSGEIFRYSLGPVERAFQKRGLTDVKRELVFVDGLMKVAADFVYKKAARDPAFAATMAAEIAAMQNWDLEHVFIWADNDDRGDHGGRQFFNAPEVMAYLQSLLRRHAPIDGILGMSQGAMVAQLAAAQA